MGVSGQLHALASVPPGKEPMDVCIVQYFVLIAVLNIKESGPLGFLYKNILIF